MIQTKEERRQHIGKALVLATIFMYVVGGTITVATGDLEFIFDRFATVAIFVFVYFMYRRLHMNLSLFAVLFLTILIHHLKLYGNVYFGIPFDRIMHFAAGMTIALIIYNYLKNSESRPSMAKVFFISLLTAAGLASMIEILEFAGYSFLGAGEGLLFYGTGDFGEYNNLSWDLMSNTLGALSGCLIMFVKGFIRIRK